ncbi:MAG TPA: alpha/beta fold hydrolase [Gaiellaceae bacterium]|nr:alpha/beta fold hydrolase [Gaiellaceae bacterium]
MASFVLVHGAWSGSWAWEKVAPLLEAAGHRVDAIDLPGRGSNPAPPAEMTMDAYARHVADRVEAAGEPVVLVGHSMGGMSISAAAELVPDRIETLVYVTAFLPGDGQSLPELAKGNPDELVQSNIVVDEAAGLCTVRPEVQREAFYGECSAEDAAWGTARRVPESLAAIGSPVHLTEERAGSVPRVYVECTRDRALTIAQQRRMWAARPCERVLTLESDHSPFLCVPAELAAHLLAVAG